ncbi:MAG: ABC transporter ATP-binding protein [Candidatus Methanomethylophilaceae archaeon]|nr:ABC transporter ATP-binding protein [Candidatus Methanomethylophilaceae archaeon]
MASPLVSMKGVSAGYGGADIIRDVDLELREGDFMAVVGPNGGGKTTLFRTVLGIITPSKGTVEVMGTSPSKGCREIGYVPQFGSFDRKYPVLAREVVAMGLRSRQGLSPFSKDTGSVEEVMEYTGVSAFADRRIGDLSGGQMQRTLLARALVSHPKMLLLDEPTASLDPEMKAGVYEILAKARSDGVTVMMVTHEVEGVEDLVNRMVRVDRCVHEIHADPHGMVCGEGVL